MGISNLDAPRGRVVRVVLDGEVLDRGPEAWDTVVAERDDVIAQLAVTRRGLLMVTSSGAVDTVHRLDADGRPGEPVDGLENSISVADDGLAADSSVDEAFVVVDTYVAPTALWKIPASGAATPGDATVGRRAVDRLVSSSSAPATGHRMARRSASS